jgi:carboxymethylenebutenolidase
MNDTPNQNLAAPGMAQGMARRGLLMTALISGFTLATTRVDAQAIHTDSKGLDAREVKIPTADGDLPGYFARPQGNGPFPIIVVVEEVFGVHEYIKDVCRRFAKLGYAAVAPELYARLGDLSKMTDDRQIFTQVISKAPDATVMTDLDSAVAFAAANHGDPNRVGINGFCRGGREVWLYAEHNPKLKAAVAWYGPVAGRTSPIQPKNPVDMAGELKCPLLGMYGGQDGSISQTDVQAAAAKARAAGQTVDIVVYPDAGHGFHADYRPSYKAKDAQAGWVRAEAWFKKYLA